MPRKSLSNKGLATGTFCIKNKRAPLPRDPALHNMDELQSHVTAITNRVSDLYGVARGIVRRLRPEILETLGLLSALEEIVKSYDETLSGCTFDLDHEGDFTNLNDKVAIAAYRCIQEGLSNIVRHAHATHAKVYLLRVQEFLHVNISDDGQGFTPGVTTMGVGLIGMRERINALRGSFEIASSPGKGTAIRIRFIT